MSEDEKNNQNNAEDEQAAKEARAEKVRQRKEEMRLKAESNASNSQSSSSNNESASQQQSSSSSSSSSSQQQPAAAPAKLREDLIASSVNFLNHPKVKPSPLSQKTAFLQKKGLTQEEINEAFKRVGESSPVDSSSQNVRPSLPNQQQQQQQYYPPPAPYNPQNQQGYRQVQQLPPPPPPSWYHTGSGLALIAIGCAGLGAGVSALAKVVLPYLTGENVLKEEKRRRKRAEEDEKKANDTKMINEMMTSIKALQEKNDTLQENLRNVLQQQNEKQRESVPVEPMSKNDKARLSETEAELKRLRAMLVDKNVSSSLSTSQSWTPQANSKPSIPAWQMASSTPKVEEPSSPSNDTEKEKQEPSRVEELPEEKETTTPSDQPTNSSKFEEIMNMVKNGQVPDDVRNIDDKPRDTNTKIEKGTREAPQKPWERRNDSN